MKFSSELKGNTCLVFPVKSSPLQYCSALCRHSGEDNYLISSDTCANNQFWEEENRHKAVCLPTIVVADMEASKYVHLSVQDTFR